MMTRKQFRALADVMRQNRPDSKDHPQYAQWLAGVEQLCKLGEKENPRFNRKLFEEACGVLE